MSYITAIGTANPSHRFSQATIADFMVRTMTLHNGDSRKLRTIFKASGIEYRHSVIGDYGKTSDFTFYSQAENFEPVPTTERRINLFRANAVSLSKVAVE